MRSVAVASVVARSSRNNPVIAPFITVFAAVLAFLGSYV
ncbi:hypothetical protein PG5_37540 [Pseudomonas sp. G5(2012)]|nr:hypothetical protein PG5_37540 [Pseudomonas sp. G5(2012)]